MDRLRIYCEVEFINNLNKPDMSDNFSSWYNFFLLLGSRILLIVNKDILSDQGIETDIISKQIIDQYNQKQCEIEINPDFFKLIKSSKLDIPLEGNELILLNNPKDNCRILEDKYRVKVISSENALERFQNLFIKESYTIQAGITHRRDLIGFFKSIDTRPVKKLLINDKYLGKHKSDFYSFIKLVLKGDKPEEVIVSCNDKLILSDFTKSIALDLKAKSVIAFKKSSIHNRKFFTEYIWGYLGHSLELKFDQVGVSIQSDNLNVSSIYYPKQKNNGVSGFDEYIKNLNEYLGEIKRIKGLESLEPIYFEYAME